MKAIASSPPISKEWELEPSQQLVRGHAANESEDWTSALNSLSRRLGWPPSLPGPQGALLGPVFPVTISVPFLNPQPPLPRHSTQKSSLTPPPTTYTHGFPCWCGPPLLCFTGHPVQRPLVFQPCRAGQAGALSWLLNTQQSRRLGQACPLWTHKWDRAVKPSSLSPLPAMSLAPPLPVFIALMSVGAWRMQDGERGCPLSPDPQGEKSGRTCQAQNSQEEPKFQLREPPPPPATVARPEPPWQQWAPEARPASHRAVKTRSCWKNRRERPQGPKGCHWPEGKQKEEKPSVLGVTCRKEARGRGTNILLWNMQLRMSLPFWNLQDSLLATLGSSLNSLAGPSKVFRPRALAAMSGRWGISGLCASAQRLPLPVKACALTYRLFSNNVLAKAAGDLLKSPQLRFSEPVFSLPTQPLDFLEWDTAPPTTLLPPLRCLDLSPSASCEPSLTPASLCFLWSLSQSSEDTEVHIF